MSQKAELTTELTPNEAQFVINVLAGAKINNLAQDAIQTLAMLQSVAAKCGAIIRLSQPLASAAKPKPEEGIKPDLKAVKATPRK